MPQHIIDRVNQLVNTQLRDLEFYDCNNQLMISEDYDMYDNMDNESYDPAEDDDATEIVKLHDNKDSPPIFSDNNAPVKEDVEPYPGEPGIIGYGNGNDAKAIPSGVYHDTNDSNPILPDDSPSTGDHTTHIPKAEELQIPGLILDTTDNTGVPKNARVEEHNETPDQNTPEQAATDETVLSDDNSPPSMAEQPAGACRTRGNKISYDHLYNPDTTAVPEFNKTIFMADSSIKYSFEYLSEGAI